MFEYAHLWTVRYYDGKGREIRTVWKSHLGIGYETEDRDYAFSGEVTERRLTHVDATGQNMTERYTYSYDDWGRPLTVHHQLGDAPIVSLHSYSYDGLGLPDSSARPDPPKNALAGFRSSAGLVEPAQVHFWRFSFFRRSYRAAGRRLRAENSIVRAGKCSKTCPGEPKPRLRAGKRPETCP